MNNFTVVIPFRDRGTDPLRQANLQRVLQHWHSFGIQPVIVDDGRTDDALFNRSAAYNRALDMTDAEVLVYTEADVLIALNQIKHAIDVAQQAPGLVIPYTDYHALTPEDSDKVRAGTLHPRNATPQYTIPNPHRDWPRTGPVNVVSRKTIDAVGGYDEQFEGCWWDDRSMAHAFEICCGPLRFIDGTLYHLYHLPGWEGDHLSQEEQQATNRNLGRFMQYRQATTPAQIRVLTAKTQITSGLL